MVINAPSLRLPHRYGLFDGGIVATEKYNTSSHVLIVGTATALRRDPIDVAIGILDVAGFAVDAILCVDDVARDPALLHPFIHAGRAVTGGGAGVDIMLGRLLQGRIRDPQVNRLIFLVIRIRQKNRRKPVEGKLAVRLWIGNRATLRCRFETRAVRLAVPERAQ